LLPGLWSSRAAAADIAGFTEPYRDIDVAAPEMGQITRLEVREGMRVQVGQVLARLDDSVWSASLEVAKTAMQSAGRLEAAEAELRLYRETLDKLLRLLQRQHATQQEVDRAQAQRDAAEARVKAAREELQVRTHEYDRAQAQLNQRRVLAPIAGVVTQVTKDEGEFVSPNDPTVVKIVQLDPLLVVFSVPVARARDLTKDAQVQVRVESIAEPVAGVVEFVSPTADAQSGTTRVRVRLPNPGEAIPSGVKCQLLLADSAVQPAAASP
jgi:RND family efflux transporter MFP subunit